jgi:hypothetical protein
LPLLGGSRRPSLQEESPIDTSLISARRTSRGNSFKEVKEGKDVKEMMESLPLRRNSLRVPSGLKMEPLSPTLPPPLPKGGEELEIANNEVATFFKMVRQKKLTADEFIYMIQKEQSQNDHYNMQVVPYSEIIGKKIKNYYTFSCKGVSRFVNSKPTEFIPVEEWFEEVKAFNEICRYNFFILFRKWKCLKKWMKIISSEKIRIVCKVLEDKMFLTNNLYRTMLLNHQTLCTEVESLTFIQFAGRDPITKEDLLIKKGDNNRTFSGALHALSNKMHQKSQEGINMVLATLKDKIKKEDSKKEDALGFPENMNYGDRSMMRHELIRIVRLSFLLEYITTETLGKCYISNIHQLFKMIELPEESVDEYEDKMGALEWVDPSKASNPNHQVGN